MELEGRDRLPSPQDLQGKIILKGTYKKDEAPVSEKWGGRKGESGREREGRVRRKGEGEEVGGEIWGEGRVRRERNREEGEFNIH